MEITEKDIVLRKLLGSSMYTDRLAKETGIDESTIVVLAREIEKEHQDWIFIGKGYGNALFNISLKVGAGVIEHFLDKEGGYSKIERERKSKQEQDETDKHRLRQLTDLQIQDLVDLPGRVTKAEVNVRIANIIAAIAAIVAILTLIFRR